MENNKILVLNGPNLNKLGSREPDIYGKIDYGTLVEMIIQKSEELGLKATIKQTSYEGELVDLINSYDYDGLIINPGAYSHYSIAILDSLKMIDKPKIEVHISNVHQREDFRNVLMTAKAVDGVISGFSAKGYIMALDAIKDLLRGSGRNGEN